MQPQRLKIAIQKSGRLSQESEALFKQCGLKMVIQKDKLIVHVENMPIDILRVRDDDIPGLVFDGVVDIGIIGQNVLEEESLSREGKMDNDYITLKELPFGGCRLSLAIPKEMPYESVQSLKDTRIATSYPYLLKRFLDSKNVPFKTSMLNGSVEVAPRAGLSDAICDLVSTGATLEANGLREVDVIYRSKAVIIQSMNAMDNEKQALINKLMTRIQGVTQATESKYIMLHAPKDRLDEICSLLPGAEMPTILPLGNDTTRVAMHMVSTESLFWETMEALKAKGASSILVLPIEKMME